MNHGSTTAVFLSSYIYFKLAVTVWNGKLSSTRGIHSHKIYNIFRSEQLPSPVQYSTV